MTERSGHRGYITSRPIDGMRVPQHIQNLVIRDYAQRNKLRFLLSATEYGMPGCYLMLEQVLDELPRIQGVIFYSIAMLPEDAPARARVYARVLEAGASLHAAAENIAMATAEEARKLEDIMRISRLAAAAPAISQVCRASTRS